MQIKLLCSYCGETSFISNLTNRCFCPYCGGQYLLDASEVWEPVIESATPSDAVLEEIQIARAKRLAAREEATKRMTERRDANRKLWNTAAIILAVVCHVVLIVLLTLFYKGILSPTPVSICTIIIIGIAIALGILYPSQNKSSLLYPDCLDDEEESYDVLIDLEYRFSKFKLSILVVPACEAVLYFLCYFGFRAVVVYLFNHGLF